MGLFDDVSRFLETRLEEFLRNNPHLELQALDEQLREQEDDTLRLILDLQKQEKRSQEQILSTAEDIKKWHSRREKAQASKRFDLAEAAQEREAALLRQGNQLWGQMQGSKQRIEQAKALYRQIQLRRKEVQAKTAEAEAARSTPKTESNWDTKGWNQNRNYNTSNDSDPLDEKFKRWEMDDELESLKRNIGR